MRMLLLVGLVGCASGGRPFEAPPPGDDPPDAAPVDPPDPPTPPIDAPTALPPDAPDPPGPCTPVITEKLVNPAMDLAPLGTGWSEVQLLNLPGGPYPIITSDGLTASSAPNKAWLGGAAGEDAVPAVGSLSDQLFQDVTFPADATTFVVSGMFAVQTSEFDFGIVFDTFSLDITETNGSQIENVLQLDNLDDAGFTAFNKTLSANLAGRTVRIRATSTNDSTAPSNFFIDSLSFKATFCP